LLATDEAARMLAVTRPTTRRSLTAPLVPRKDAAMSTSSLFTDQFSVDSIGSRQTDAEPVIAGPATRARLVEEIVRVNRSATRAFLDRFNDQALRIYLDHLQFASVPRGREARWVRPGDTRAICAADAA